MKKVCYCFWNTKNQPVEWRIFVKSKNWSSRVRASVINASKSTPWFVTGLTNPSLDSPLQEIPCPLRRRGEKYYTSTFTSQEITGCTLLQIALLIYIMLLFGCQKKKKFYLYLIWEMNGERTRTHTDTYTHTY